MQNEYNTNQCSNERENESQNKRVLQHLGTGYENNERRRDNI